MKKVVLLLAVLFAAFTSVSAQKNYITGAVSYTKATDVEATYSVSPTIGHYVTKHVSVGVTGEFGKAGEAKTSNIGVFGRCDFASLGKSCTLWSQLTLTNESATTSGVTENEFDANLGLGGNYDINKKWALTMHVSDLVSYESADGSSVLTVGFSGLNNPLATSKFGVV